MKHGTQTWWTEKVDGCKLYNTRLWVSSAVLRKHFTIIPDNLRPKLVMRVRDPAGRKKLSVSGALQANSKCYNIEVNARGAGFRGVSVASGSHRGHLRGMHGCARAAAHSFPPS